MRVWRLLAVVATLFGALAAVSSPASAQTTTPPCEVGRALVNVTYRFVNDQDLTSDERVWALGSGTATFRLYRTGADTFCATTTLVGTFTTFAGPSPAGTGTVPAGHTGRFAIQSSLRFQGSFAPSLPTRGFVGTFDAGCDQFECESPIQFGRKYLNVTGPPVVESFRAAYVSSCGVWIQTSEGELGDIAC
jgi:hypothetical protein